MRLIIHVLRDLLAPSGALFPNKVYIIIIIITDSAMRLVAALLRQTSSDMTDVLSIMNVNNGVAAILLQTYRLSMSMNF